MLQTATAPATVRHQQRSRTMTPSELKHHNDTVEWLLKHKVHRVRAYLKSLSPEQLASVYESRTEEDAVAFNDHMHDQVAKHGCD
jgi:hypothetical protein